MDLIIDTLKSELTGSDLHFHYLIKRPDQIRLVVPGPRQGDSWHASHGLVDHTHCPIDAHSVPVAGWGLWICHAFMDEVVRIVHLEYSCLIPPEKSYRCS